MSQAVAAFAQQFPLIYQLFTTRLKWSLGFIAALFLILAVSLYAQLLHTADGLFTSAGPIIGGDFIVFDHAARVAGTPDMLSIYEMKNLQAQLQAAHPGQGDFAFAWMYPPTMSLVLAPFAWPDYLTSFTLWVAIFASAQWVVAFWELVNWADVERRLDNALCADLALEPGAGRDADPSRLRLIRK